MINAIINYNYMQNALVAALITSLICGIIGTIIVEKRLVSMSGGIAHASFGGIGAGYFFGIEPILGGLVFAVTASLSVAKLQKHANAYTDAIVNIFWSGGMAIGILFIAMTKGYPPDMTSYLFGDILSVNMTYLYVMIVLTLLILSLIISLFNYWKIYLFDEEYALIIGIRTVFLETIIYVLIALSIVILTKVVGIILAMAMLTIPPSIAKLYTYDLKKIMFLAVIIGMLMSLSGLSLSYYFNIPSGATIIIVAIIFYFIALLSKSNP